MRREKLVIELEIDVDDILDDGILQEAINNHESDAPPMTVVSAILNWGGETRR